MIYSDFTWHFLHHILEMTHLVVPTTLSDRIRRQRLLLRIHLISNGSRLSVVGLVLVPSRVVLPHLRPLREPHLRVIWHLTQVRRLFKKNVHSFTNNCPALQSPESKS